MEDEESGSRRELMKPPENNNNKNILNKIRQSGRLCEVKHKHFNWE
jgi:hypothetical protein